ncbi:MAG: TadE family protein [Chloroflexota bacterium]
MRIPNSFGGRPRPRHTTRGQSLVEFALVTPILLFLVVLVADFGRVFATVVLVEGAARNAAEAVANAYVATPPGGALNVPAPAYDAAYYDPLHAAAAESVCAETAELPNANFDPGTGRCPGMPLVATCIHDGRDSCGGADDDQNAAIPAECDELLTAMAPTQAAGAGRYVEVRICYRFQSILRMPLLSFGDIWVQRTRTFVIPCYFVLGQDECG